MNSEILPSGPPWPLRMGPYSLHDVLGRGAMGVVYRAKHSMTGEVAALKTAARATGAAFSSIRHEIRALRVIRHPSIVRLRASDIDGRCPWYAMDLLEGDTLRARLGSVLSDEPPVPWDQLRESIVEILRHLCQPLTFLHQMGFVHRDIKPENIFIRRNESPVLMDFGIVSRFGGSTGREALAMGGEITGTMTYMAPEQIAGALVDARADLYALGCILYEALTGSLPFAAAPNPLERKLRSRPPPPSRFNGDLPEQLDHLALGLLEPKPHDRIGYAEDVGTILDSVCSGPPPPPKRSKPYLHRAAYHGRKLALKKIRTLLGGAERARGAIIYIGGERGIGKTRLVMEFATAAAWRGFAVIMNECPPARSPEEADQKPEPNASSHALLSLRHALEDRLHDRTLKADLPSMCGSDMLEGLKDLLLSSSERDPLLIVIDNLHGADPRLLELLQDLAQEDLDGKCLLVIGIYRTCEVPEQVVRIVQNPRTERMILAEMANEDLEAMTCGMLAMDEPPRPLSDRIVDESAGNPLRVAAGLGAAMNSGALLRSRHGKWRVRAHSGDALPNGGVRTVRACVRG